MGQGTLVSRTIQVLLEVIKETPLKEKLRFVPSYSVGHQVGECLSCSGGVLDQEDRKGETLQGEDGPRSLGFFILEFRKKADQEAGLFFVDGEKWVSVSSQKCIA